jgi:hypothetical protein
VTEDGNVRVVEGGVFGTRAEGRSPITAHSSAARRFVVTRLDLPPLASAKAPADIRQICVDGGMLPIDLYGFNRSSRRSRLLALLRSAGQLLRWAPALSTATSLVVQYPVGRLNEYLVTRILGRGRTVCLLHDLELLRRPALARREADTLSRFDVIVVHSQAMARRLKAEQMGVPTVVLGAFDFLMQSPPAIPAGERPRALYIFGNLSPEKASYVYAVDPSHTQVSVEAYGPNCDVTRLHPRVSWKGVLDPERPALSCVDGFGLVWDGDSSAGLAGPCGEYLRFNAPHKFSLYLALGLPVVVPAASAIAAFVAEHGLGLCVDSIDRALREIQDCGDADWQRMVAAVQKVQEHVVRGAFATEALEKAGAFGSPVFDRCEA